LGRQNDFGLFKRSELHIHPAIELLVDKGYQGIAAFHDNSFIPFKKPKNGTLTESQRLFNRELAKLRIVIEYVFAKLKVFRILAGLYRNRWRRFGLRFNLIASLYNLELANAAA
jgi:transposase